MLRQDLSFSVRGLECAAWLYLPDRESPFPAVVMAHGFCATRPLRLDAYAERFAQAGYAVFVFDYRHFGDSDGEPRQLLDIARQLEDWRAALAAVRKIPDVDPGRVAVWGTSFSGGHALTLCAQDESIAAAVVQVPFVDGLATARLVKPGAIARLAGHTLVDAMRGLWGLSPHYIAAIGLPGETAAITAADARQIEMKLVPPGVVWRNEVAARVLLSLLRYRPGRSVERIRAPVLYYLAEHDRVTSFPAAVDAAARTRLAETIRRPLGHFDVYVGEHFERAVAAQIEFLNRHVGRRDAHE